jgi:hypothetical protein
MLFLSVGILAILAYDAGRLSGSRSGDRRRSFGIGLGTIVCGKSVLSADLFGALDAASSADASINSRASACAPLTCLNRPHGVGWISLFAVGFAACVVCVPWAWSDVRILGGSGARRTDVVSASAGPCEVTDGLSARAHVLVIGASGAGLRRRSKVGGVGRSGLQVPPGQAHTVMAEGGIAAALANVDDRDGWVSHFADTMRGGHMSTTGAGRAAQGAPDRVRDSRPGRDVRSHRGRPHLQRNFGGHRYRWRVATAPASSDRTLPDHGIHRGIDVHMECTIVRLLTAAGGSSARSATSGSAGASRFSRHTPVALPAASDERSRSRAAAGSTGDGHTLAYGRALI